MSLLSVAIKPLISTAISVVGGGTIKYWLIGGGVVAALIAISSTYFSFVHHIRHEAFLEEQAQLDKEMIISQNEEITRYKSLLKLQAAFSQQFQDDLAKIAGDSSKVDDFIKSIEAQKSDRPASDILKETIKRLP